MSLTIEQQKRLTEFLGGCWHEWSTFESGGQTFTCRPCKKCGSIMEDDESFLDFSDWRVVGGLMEKRNAQYDSFKNDGLWYVRFGYNGKPQGVHEDLKTAICLAIDTYLVEQENSK